MSGLSIGVSALTASQRVLDLIGENIANANTPGYHRQVENLVERAPTLVGGLVIGSGVAVTDIVRQQSLFLDKALNQQTADAGHAAAQLDSLTQLESYLTSGTGSVQDRLDTFFNGLEQLASNPDDTTQRQIVIGSAGAVADQFNFLSGQLQSQRTTLDTQIDATLSEINSRTSQIAQLNGQIQRLTVQGVQPNDLLDQRDQLINEVAQRVGGQTVEQADGQTNLIVGGAVLVGGTQSVNLVKASDAAGNVVVTAAGASAPLTISNGQLAGLLQVRNQFLTDYQSRLDALAKGLIQGINGIQATGLGLAGPASLLSGQSGVSSTTLPLNQANPAFPIQAGNLFITVTDKTTGKQTLSAVAINPATQSLQDVAAAISGVNHIQAVVDQQTGTLKILAQPGFAFEFTGRPQTSPDPAGITGTTVPAVAGQYTGPGNDTYTYQVVNSGTVGVTPNLTLQVKNSSNTVIASLNIGQGYAPGTALTVVGGITVQLTAGSANAGDSFSSRVVAQPDSSGILTALGINSLFTGQSARDIGVDPALVADPGQLAASRTGQPGDGSNLLLMATVRNQKLLGNGTQTLNEGYAAMVGNIGTQVQQVSHEKDNQDLLGQTLQTERQGVSGVDPNEELVKMLQFQRSYQVAARYITTVNSTLDDLLKLI